MADGLYVFLDFDNTLSDMAALQVQYVQALSRILSREFGGDATQWAPILKAELEASMAGYAEAFVGNPLAGYNAWIEKERERAAAAVLAGMAVAQPAEESLHALAKRVQFDALASCNTMLPGVQEMFEGLQADGININLASTQESEYLLAALIGAGVESYVETKFGPDLVDCAKEGPEFYRRIFAVCEIRPSQAVVVDDQAICLDWAEEAGARVVQACTSPSAEEPEFPIVLSNLRDLPRLLSMGVA